VRCEISHNELTKLAAAAGNHDIHESSIPACSFLRLDAVRADHAARPSGWLVQSLYY